MDQKTLEENDSNFNCTKILHGVDEPIACPTPAKTSEPLPPKSKEGPIQLPEKYKALADLFEHMSCSLRLLLLFKRSPTFQNICTQVEVLSKRKFSYMQLAQIKFILSEAIHIGKVLIHDRKTLCMKPDLKITLTYEVVRGHTCESSSMALQQLFGSRLTHFFNTHPEGTEIPEAPLPEPFQQRTKSLIYEDLSVDPSTIVSSSTSHENQQSLQECHPNPFKRHFSKQNVVVEADNIQCFLANQTTLSCRSSSCPDNQQSESESKWHEKCITSCLKSDSMNDLEMERGQLKESNFVCFQPGVINTPARLICSPKSVRVGSYESPELKISSSIDVLMTETPAQSAPARLAPSSDVKVKIMTSRNSISCNKPAKRVLDFSHKEGDDDALDISVDNLESGRDVHENMAETCRGCVEDLDASSFVVLPQKVEESPGCSATPKQTSLPLLGLVNVIYSIFCSVKCSPITKEELLQKIIMNSLDVVEIREVEEQIELLEKVVPDWICRKLVPSGDIMYCIKKVADLDSIRSRLSIELC